MAIPTIHRLALSIGLVAAGCSTAPPVQPRVETSTPVAAAPSTTPEPSEAEQRADALIADMQRREVEQAAFDRANPHREPSPTELLERLRVGASLSPSAPVADNTAQVIGATPTVIRSSLSEGIVAGERDERFWKARMREAQAQVDSATNALAAARMALADLEARYVAKDGTMHRTVADNVFKQRNEVAQRTADAASAQGRMNQLIEEARRENVPPGWLRP